TSPMSRRSEVRLFRALISATLTPCFLAIFQRLSPLATVWVAGMLLAPPVGVAENRRTVPLFWLGGVKRSAGGGAMSPAEPVAVRDVVLATSVLRSGVLT